MSGVDVVARYGSGTLTGPLGDGEPRLLAVHLAGLRGAPARDAVGIAALPVEVRRSLVEQLLSLEGPDALRLGWLLEALTRDLPGAVGTGAALGLRGQVLDVWSRWRGFELASLLRLVRRCGGDVPAHFTTLARMTTPLPDPFDAPSSGGRADRGSVSLSPGEAWTDEVIADLPRLGRDWWDLLVHASTATAAKPSQKWDRGAAALVAVVGAERFRATLLRWLAPAGGGWAPGDDGGRPVEPHNVTVLRGLLWMLSGLPADPSTATARAVGAVVGASLRKVPGVGPRSAKVAGAGVFALDRMEGDAPLAELARLALRTTHGPVARQLEAAVQRRADALGLTREEVEELAVPACGLTAVGRREQVLGSATAEFTVSGTKVALTWRDAAGRAVRSVPAAVRREHAEELAELRADAKHAAAVLTAQAERLDRQFLARRTWAFAAWRERYLDHPLVGTLGRRLIWVVAGTPCAWADGALRTVGDEVVEPAADARVELWHPIGREVAEVAAWRERLLRHEVVQPFKQAHREVYLLTDAERATGTYSNRFAAHVLRQHQFHALAGARGWRDQLRIVAGLEVPPPVRELPGWGLRAEFWVDGVGEHRGTDTADSGAFLRLATDRVRFLPCGAPRGGEAPGGDGRADEGARPFGPVPLEDVPPLVLSEVMRDVDLFVGVASIGNDPAWSDGGPEGRYRDYWRSYSFGELSATAATRRELLARLVPRLAVAQRCTLEERFLVVRGDLRTYRIHLGSGNVLMSPGDEYLCIVPAASAAAPGEVFLPFEGDGILGIVLSKALLLADDTRITDPGITSQIRGGARA
ncbi:DUF4132 domain-containing protein [Kineococcus xinjiangensis]|uniref:DUF4132 domain-containing protein n=1 Tax=Kineococcus xinjiangensis TaxID=512762 RepID=UPI001B800418|nr:DUF4132 domain-containing protein [Kineococcus xinjiangensis]